MIETLARSSLRSTDGAALPGTPQIIASLKIGSERLMGRHGALLCLAVRDLMNQAGLTAPLGEEAATYCVLDVQTEDPLVTEVVNNPQPTLAQAFASRIPPTQSLRELPSVLAFWPTVLSGAQGPLRIFPSGVSSFTAARQQAELDLADGTCRLAFVISVTSDPESVAGDLLRAGAKA